jgi:2-polyprenyl-6-hydroxyphenyl methylase/3-demethylubiquinone-9 3-methyltransferase
MDYYSDRLSADRLKQVYDLATPRISQYLDAELDHVLGRLRRRDTVLELGCGYGRILGDLAGRAREAVGVDTSLDSLRLAKQELSGVSGCGLVCGDASRLPFAAGAFDCTVCIQNGISAFHVDRGDLVGEALRVTRPGGLALFSSYSARLWQARLEWFRLQSEAGLLGELDLERTGDGKIVCKDGFTASTVGPDEFRALVRGLRADALIIEVDGSSLFCEIRKL